MATPTRWAALTAAGLLLVSCASDPKATPMPDGATAAPPEGWFGFCLRRLHDEPRCLPPGEPDEPLAGDRTPA